MDGRSFSAVLLAGVLTGSELTSWGIVHPTLWKLEHNEQVRAEKLVYKRFGTIDPFLMTATTAACFVAASGLHGRSRETGARRRRLLHSDARDHADREHADQPPRLPLGRGPWRPGGMAPLAPALGQTSQHPDPA
jgi:hypothetical protein